MAEAAAVWGVDLPIVIAIYLIVIMYIGYYSYRRRIGVTVKDFFMASKLLGYVVLGIGLFATIASGNTFVGYSAKAYRAGLYFLVAPAFYVSILVGLMILGAKLIPIALRRGYVTPGDFFKDRFGSRSLMLFLIALMFWGTFVQFFEQSIAMGYIGEVTSAGYIPYAVSAAIFMAVVLFVMLLGGFRGTALANFIMGTVMIAAMLGVLFGIIPILGGANALASLANNAKLAAKLAPQSPTFAYGWASTIVLVMFGVLCYYQIWMFVVAAKDFKTLRRQYIFTPAIYTVVPTIFVIMGLIGLAVFPGLSKMESERIVPLLVNEAARRSAVGYVLGELTYVSVISATLSTAAAVIFALGMVLSKDIYAKFINPAASERRIINVSRVIMVLLAILGYVIVMTPKFTLWRWVELKFEVGMQAVPPLLLGLYIPWVNAKGAWAGSVIGFIIAVGLALSGHVKIYGIHAGVIGFIVNLLIVLLVSYLTRKPEEVEAASKIIMAR
ncbi:MAG: sodium:pantothenate symporter [Desulfurococcales archaeon ex4484_204]|nr:MAG: sodium:pantothenate symporter [Desulfurococcales archaeon ex4484_204]